MTLMSLMALMALIDVCKELITYYKTKSMYCICRMRYDYFWLSPEMMTYCKDKYKPKVDTINELYDLETRRSNRNVWKKSKTSEAMVEQSSLSATVSARWHKFVILLHGSRRASSKNWEMPNLL